MVFIINSAPGVGKTTLLGSLQGRLPDGFALLDGDDVGRVVPFENTVEWLDLIQDNLVTCCVNFRKYGKANIVIGFVFPGQERLLRLKGLLETEGFPVRHVTLFCDDQEVARRIRKRNTSRMIGVEQAILHNAHIKSLPSDCRIDTTGLDPHETCSKVLGYIVSNIK